MRIFEIDYLNLNIQIQNIKTKMLNIEMEINNNINMKMNQINNMQMQMNQMNNFMLKKNDNIQENIIEKKNVLFHSDKDEWKMVMVFDGGITVSEMLKQYLEKIAKPELFKSDEIWFLYNAVKINRNDNTKIRDKFKDSQNLSITVVRSKPVFGG